MRGFTHLNKDDFSVYFETAKQFGTASSTKMFWNPNRNQNQEQSTRKSSRRNKDETARKDIMRTRVSDHRCKVSWVPFSTHKNTETAQKTESKVTTKRIHDSSFIGSLPRSASSTRGGYHSSRPC